MAGPSRYYAVYSAAIASGATLSGEVDLSGAQGTVFLEICSIPTNTQHYIQAAATSGGTYRRVYQAPLNSATVGTNLFAIASAATGIIPIPNGLRYMKVEATMAVVDGASYRILIGD